MALAIYKTPDPHSAFSTGTAMNPLSHSFDGVRGGTVTRRYYVRNDSNLYYYTAITVQPVYSNGVNIITGTDGFYWKLIAGDTKPLEEQWSLVLPANQISIPNIGSAGSFDISTYEPFWLRIVVPRGAPTRNHIGIKLRLDFTQTAV